MLSSHISWLLQIILIRENYFLLGDLGIPNILNEQPIVASSIWQSIDYEAQKIAHCFFLFCFVEGFFVFEQ